MEGGNKASVVPQYLGALTACLSAFSLGTVLGWNSPASAKIMKEYNVKDTDIAWVGSIMLFSAGMSMFPMSILIDKFGRKLVMLVLVFPFIGGWVVLMIANEIWIFGVGRIITGFCGGAYSVAVPVFIGEISEARVRGVLGSCFQFLLVIGVLYAYIVGSFANIFVLSLACAIPNVIFFILFLIFIPDTPQYHLTKNNKEKAKKSLQFFRGKNADVGAELATMEAAVKDSQNDNKTLKERFSSTAAKKSMTIGVGLMVLQQLSGINAVVFNATTIFENAGSTLEPEYCQITIGAVMVAATSLAVIFAEKAGRKMLMLVSAAGMCFCHVILGVYYTFLSSDPDSVANLGWLPLIILCLYIVVFSIGAGPVPWLMMGELFPAEIKGIGASLASLTNWMMAFIVTLVFPYMRAGIGDNFSFWIFGIVCFLGVLFVIFVCIETKGKTLAEVQAQLEGN